MAAIVGFSTIALLALTALLLGAGGSQARTAFVGLAVVAIVATLAAVWRS
jgi:hypothetical protein